VVAPVKQAKKLNIPIPLGRTVDDYYTRCPGGYQPPVSYLRHVKKPDESLDPSSIDYVLEQADVKWLRKRGNSDVKLLDEDRLEKAIDVLEKATHLPQTTTSGVAAVVAPPKPSSSSSSAANATASTLVEPVSQETAEALLASRLEMPSTSASREVIADVYQYWLAKRTARGRSLLRRFVPPTAPDDTNPHHVFRPREKVSASCLMLWAYTPWGEVTSNDSCCFEPDASTSADSPIFANWTKLLTWFAYSRECHGSLWCYCYC